MERILRILRFYERNIKLSALVTVILFSLLIGLSSWDIYLYHIYKIKQNATTILTYTPKSSDSFEKTYHHYTVDPYLDEHHPIIRLPTNVIPKHYTVTLKPDVYPFQRIRGNVEIVVDIFPGTTSVILNADPYGTYKARINNDKVNAHKGKDFLILSMPTMNQLDRTNIISIDFISIFEEPHSRRTSIPNIDANNNSQNLISTEFEPTYARYFFPCFDEPEFKATFTLVIEKPKNIKQHNYMVLDNSPEENRTSFVGPSRVNPFYENIRFKTTEPISTFLFGFLLSPEFEYIDYDIQGLKLRVHFRPKLELSKNLKEAYKIIKFSIDKLNDLSSIGINEVLNKLDIVAVPNYLSNIKQRWGLITLRESELFFNYKHSVNDLKSLTATISRELSHIWFGNIVTARWWDDLWLHESLATYFQYIVIDEINPNWSGWDEFLVKVINTALDADTKLHGHPLKNYKMDTYEDIIASYYDTITLNKGAALFETIKDMHNDRNFVFNALKNYMKLFKFRNANTDDFWSQFDRLFYKDMVNIMTPFTTQSGYPVVNLQYNNKTDIVTLTQKWFVCDFSNPKNYTNSSNNKRWHIPVVILSKKGRQMVPAWFLNESEHFIPTLFKKNYSWLLLQRFYFRVNYTEYMWQQLTANIFGLIAKNRGILLDDAFSLAEAGELNYSIPFNLATYLKREVNYIPWAVARSKFTKLQNYFKSCSARYKEQLTQLNKFIVSIIKPQFNQYRWGDFDPTIRIAARDEIFQLACSAEYEGCLKNCTQILDGWLFHDKPFVPNNLRHIIYTYGMVNADYRKWNRLFEIYKNEQDPIEKYKLLIGLASVRNRDLIIRTIYLHQEKYIDNEHLINVFTHIAQLSDTGANEVWHYMGKYWLRLIDPFKYHSPHGIKFLIDITNTFGKPVKLKDLEAFFDIYGQFLFANTKNEINRNVEHNVNWLEKFKNIVLEELSKMIPK